MPEAPAAPPPAAPAAPSPNAAPTPELHITAASVADKGPAPPPPPKGSARERMFEDLRKKAAAPAPEKPADKPAPAESPATAPAAGDQPPPEPEPGAAPPDKKKVNPWKLVDEHKAARAKAEAEIAELRKKVPDEAKLKSEQEKYSALEKRAKELEEEIRYVNFAKSDEFARDYQKPYEEAWKRAMQDLNELTVSDPESGAERPIAPQDIWELVNLPLKEAKARAGELYGEFATDVMEHRKELKTLLDKKMDALEQARKNGAARDQERQKKMAEYHENMRKQIGEIWTKYNNEAVSDEKYGKYFKPMEGDDEGNQRLARGFAMADKAFTVDPRNPNLTEAQRADIVRLHSAIRHRAAAFGRTLYLLQKTEAQVKSLQGELAKYKATEPGKGEGVPAAASASGGTAKDQMLGALRKLAH